MLTSRVPSSVYLYSVREECQWLSVLCLSQFHVTQEKYFKDKYFSCTLLDQNLCSSSSSVRCHRIFTDSPLSSRGVNGRCDSFGPVVFTPGDRKGQLDSRLSGGPQSRRRQHRICLKSVSPYPVASTSPDVSSQKTNLVQVNDQGVMSAARHV